MLMGLIMKVCISQLSLLGQRELELFKTITTSRTQQLGIFAELHGGYTEKYTEQNKTLIDLALPLHLMVGTVQFLLFSIVNNKSKMKRSTERQEGTS